MFALNGRKAQMAIPRQQSIRERRDIMARHRMARVFEHEQQHNWMSRVRQQL